MALDELGRREIRYGGFAVPRFAVVVGGVRLTEASGVVSNLQVESILDGADQFSFDATYPFDHESGEFDGFPSALSVGRRVEVHVGYGDDTARLLLGSVASVRTAYPTDRAPFVRVSGFNRLQELAADLTDRVWTDETDAEVVETIARARGLTPDVTPTDTSRQTRSQNQKTDLAFVGHLARENGFEYFVRGDTLTFRPPAYDSSPVLTFRFGESLRSFAVERTRTNSVESVVVRHWDRTANREIRGVAGESDAGPGATRTVNLPVESQAEAIDRAEGILERLSRESVHGNGDIMGIPEMRAGHNVRIEGIGGELTNDYYVTSATHSVGEAGYMVSFQVTEAPV
jgi:hypothetical protein